VNDVVTVWWRQLGSAALVGTARRPVPALPSIGVAVREGARPDELALDAAAIGAAFRLAGRQPEAGVPLPEPAADDERPEAPARAVQLLELLLSQPPGGAETAGRLLEHWLRACDAAGLRLPHRLLPLALDRAGDEALRRHLVPVLDQRGRWLAAQNPDWAWAADDGRAEGQPAPVDPDDWARLPAPERLAVLAELRLADPAAARALLLGTWSTDSAKDRRAHLEALHPGLGPADEELLEAALDDRSAGVREVAADLLDGLPTSRRAVRMAERLRPLLRETGLLRKAIEIELPDDPDAVGVRDGLGKAPHGRSQRGWWLERIVAGAPFEVWGHPADVVVPRLHDQDALAGLRRAAQVRRTPDWLLALLERGADVHLLLRALPLADRSTWVTARLPETRLLLDLAGMLAAVPAPWTPQLSAVVVQRIKDDKAMPMWLGQLLPSLVDGLNPDAVASLQSWRERARLEARFDRALGRLIQSHSIRRTITEAFQ
jgi:hypothetical protein